MVTQIPNTRRDELIQIGKNTGLNRTQVDELETILLTEAKDDLRNSVISPLTYVLVVAAIEIAYIRLTR